MHVERQIEIDRETDRQRGLGKEEEVGRETRQMETHTERDSDRTERQRDRNRERQAEREIFFFSSYKGSYHKGRLILLCRHYQQISDHL